MNKWSLICSTFLGTKNLLHSTSLFVFISSRYHITFQLFLPSHFSLEQMLMFSYFRYMLLDSFSYSYSVKPSSHLNISGRSFRKELLSESVLSNKMQYFWNTSLRKFISKYSLDTWTCSNLQKKLSDSAIGIAMFIINYPTVCHSAHIRPCETKTF